MAIDITSKTVTEILMIFFTQDPGVLLLDFSISITSRKLKIYYKVCRVYRAYTIINHLPYHHE